MRSPLSRRCQCVPPNAELEDVLAATQYVSVGALRSWSPVNNCLSTIPLTVILIGSGNALVSIAYYVATERVVEISMRTAFFGFFCAALATLQFGSSAAYAGGSLYSDHRVGYGAPYIAPVGWRNSYRWYRDYAPLYPRHHYQPPAVVVVPPPVTYYPPPRRIFSRGYRRGYIYGPRGTYYPKYGHRHRGYNRGW